MRLIVSWVRRCSRLTRATLWPLTRAMRTFVAFSARGGQQGFSNCAGVVLVYGLQAWEDARADDLPDWLAHKYQLCEDVFPKNEKDKKAESVAFLTVLCGYLHVSAQRHILCIFWSWLHPQSSSLSSPPKQPQAVFPLHHGDDNNDLKAILSSSTSKCAKEDMPFFFFAAGFAFCFFLFAAPLSSFSASSSFFSHLLVSAKTWADATVVKSYFTCHTPLLQIQTLRYQITDGWDCLLVVGNKLLVGLLKLTERETSVR